MHKKGQNDTFVLHIGAHPHDHHVKSFKPVIKSKSGESERHAEKHKNPSWFIKFVDFVWDKIKFLALTAIIFFLIYSVLNWQALWINAEYYYQKLDGTERVVEKSVGKKVPRKAALISQAAIKADLFVPPLNIEIMPPDARLVIPRINQNVPIVGVKNENLIARQWNNLEQDIQMALKNGVIHYPGTALPGEGGNVVITGHSSYYVWDSGRFKDVFALLHDVRLEDRVILYFNQKKYTYEIVDRKVVLPKEVDVLSASKSEQLTLITCTPIGTNLKRLVLTGKLASVE